MARSAVGTFWLDLVVALGTSDFCQRGGDGTTIAGIHDSTFPPVASVTISDLRTDGWISPMLHPIGIMVSNAALAITHCLWVAAEQPHTADVSSRLSGNLTLTWQALLSDSALSALRFENGLPNSLALESLEYD